MTLSGVPFESSGGKGDRRGGFVVGLPACGGAESGRAWRRQIPMMKTRLLFGLVIVTACISRGNPTPDPTPDVPTGMDMLPPIDDAPPGVDVPRDRPMCSPTMRPEGSPATCRDGLDNDCNGFADCDDFRCRTCENPTCLTNNQVILGRDAGTCTCMAAAEDTTAACSDGLDNDCDGFTDCQDFSCVSCRVTVCQADGGIPRGDAGFCQCRSPDENTNATCSNGQDDDCNGFTDCQDFACSRADAGTVTVCDGGTPPRDGGTCVPSGPENTAAACGDGIDNDCDRFTDCADFNCRSCAIPSCFRDGGVILGDGGTCMCRGTENTTAACMNGQDDDCDGFIDCRDFDCTRADAGAVTSCDAFVPTDATADASAD